MIGLVLVQVAIICVAGGLITESGRSRSSVPPDVCLIKGTVYGMVAIATWMLMSVRIRFLRYLAMVPPIYVGQYLLTRLNGDQADRDFSTLAGLVVVHVALFSCMVIPRWNELINATRKYSIADLLILTTATGVVLKVAFDAKPANVVTNTSLFWLGTVWIWVSMTLLSIFSIRTMLSRRWPRAFGWAAAGSVLLLILAATLSAGQNRVLSNIAAVRGPDGSIVVFGPGFLNPFFHYADILLGYCVTVGGYALIGRLPSVRWREIHLWRDRLDGNR